MKLTTFVGRKSSWSQMGGNIDRVKYPLGYIGTSARLKRYIG